MGQTPWGVSTNLTTETCQCYGSTNISNNNTSTSRNGRGPIIYPNGMRYQSITMMSMEEKNSMINASFVVHQLLRMRPT